MGQRLTAPMLSAPERVEHLASDKSGRDAYFTKKTEPDAKPNRPEDGANKICVITVDAGEDRVSTSQVLKSDFLDLFKSPNPDFKCSYMFYIIQHKLNFVYLVVQFGSCGNKHDGHT